MTDNLSKEKRSKVMARLLENAIPAKIDGRDLQIHVEYPLSRVLLAIESNTRRNHKKNIIVADPTGFEPAT